MRRDSFILNRPWRLLLLCALAVYMLPSSLLQAQDCGQLKDQLSYEAYQGDMAGVLGILIDGCDPNARDSKNNLAPLVYAIRQGKEDVALQLLDANADANIKSNEGWTVLAMTSDSDNRPSPRLMEALLDHGAVVNALGPDLWTPLMLACKNPSNTKLIELLLEHHADPNAKNASGWTPLDIALWNGWQKDKALPLQAVQLLLAYGADPNQTGTPAWPPLRWAVDTERGNKDVFATLLAAHADPNMKLVNNSWESLLDWALINPDPFFTTMIVKNGADLKAVDFDNRPVISGACDIGPERIRLLADLGADFTWRSPEGEHAQSKSVVMAENCWTRENLRTLVDLSVDLDDALGSASFGASEQLEALLDAGADKFSTERIGMATWLFNPDSLFLCLIHNDDKVRVIRLLIDHGTDVLAKDRINHPPARYSGGATALEELDALNADNKADPTYIEARAVLSAAMDRREATLGFIDSATKRLSHTAKTQRPLALRQAFLDGLEMYRDDPYSLELRVFLADMANKIGTLPPPPTAALKHEQAAQRLYVNAHTRSEMLDVAAEYEQALRIAPWVSAYYEDLATLYELAGSHARAHRFALMYLATNPPDRQSFENQMAVWFPS